jgi:hypothetical protein
LDNPGRGVTLTLCHLAEFVPTGRRFIGAGCHADGMGRGKADEQTTNNQTMVQIRPRQFFVPPVMMAF